MRFLANINEKCNHSITINENLKVYNQAYFAVAFLKMSGLNHLITQIRTFLKSGGQLVIVVGQNFALTEPSALLELHKTFKPFPVSKLFLAKANSENKVFHPKFYLFKSGLGCCVISGSANITNGGLINNKETSIIAECNETDAIWKDAKNYFNQLINIENSDEASLLVIKQYEIFYEQQKQYNKRTKPNPTKSESQLLFNYDKLLAHLEKFNNPDRQKNFKDKIKNYKKAKEVLDQIANNPRLTQKQFEPLLDNLVGSKEVNRLWHSGSLFRLRKKVYPYFNEFGDLIRYVRENKNQPTDIIFENAKAKVKVIKGAAVNYITEIMMTYNYYDFANINRNPITVLKIEGGVNLKNHSSAFTGVDYDEYCELIKEISSKLGLRNMLEADSFFNDIYWKLN